MNFFDIIQKLEEGTHEYDNIRGFRSSKGVSPEEINVAKYIAAYFKKNGGSNISVYDVEEDGLIITITSIADGIARARVISGGNSENISMNIETKNIIFSKPALNKKNEKESDYQRAMRIEAQKKISQKYKEAQKPQEQLKKALKK